MNSHAVNRGGLRWQHTVLWMWPRNMDSYCSILLPIMQAIRRILRALTKSQVLDAGKILEVLSLYSSPPY
jgi:hypothetical protein